ncbi:hypothetical protein D3C76_1166750 [compost metagenome]
MTEGQAATVVFRQSGCQQGLEALAVGDAGQRILLGQALQGVFQDAAFAHMAQATAQHAGIEQVAHQPVTHAIGWGLRLMVEQQHRRQAATARRRLKLRDGQ